MYARVFANLIDSTLDVCGRGARLEITARRKGQGVLVQILGGRASSSMRPLQVPPTTGEGLPDGGGLGISIARTLVSAVGGELEVRSAPGRRMFRVLLPPAPRVRVRPRPVEETLYFNSSK